MVQSIIVILIGIAVVVFVAKRIYRIFSRKNTPAGPCDDCPGCALKSKNGNAAHSRHIGRFVKPGL